MKCRRHWRTPSATILALGLAFSAGGCALAEQAEMLLIRQQSVQDALVTTVADVESASPALAQQLYLLEDDLYAACDRLREAGQRRLEGREVDSGLKWQVITTLNKCESTTSAIERMVQKAERGDIDALQITGIQTSGYDRN